MHEARSCPTLHFKRETQPSYNDFNRSIRIHNRLSKCVEEPLKSDFDKTVLDDSRTRLKASGSTSHILCGFAMVCAAELQSNNPGDTDLPDAFWVAYVVNTVLLVCVHAFSIMINTFVMPKLDVEIKKPSSDVYKFKSFVEVAWVVSNLFGLFLFLIELQLLLWVKFWDYAFSAAIAGTIILIPIIFIFIYFAAYSYYTHVSLRLRATAKEIKDLEDLSKRLDSYQY